MIKKRYGCFLYEVTIAFLIAEDGRNGETVYVGAGMALEDCSDWNGFAEEIKQHPALKDKKYEIVNIKAKGYTTLTTYSI